MMKLKVTKEHIEKIFQDFSNTRVAIIGDVMLDAYNFGTVHRISPEAPVPIVQVQKMDFRLGGAANVALNIKMMGATPYIFSVFGNDHESDIFASLLKKRQLIPDFVMKLSDRPTTVKTRVIANDQQQLIRLDHESTKSIDAETTKKISAAFLDNINNIDVVLFQDYDKGLITPELITKIIRESRNKNIPVLVDPKKRHFFNYNMATVFKPNLKELKEGLHIDLPKPLNIKALRDASQILFSKMNMDILCITLSDEGIYVNDQKEDFILPAYKRNIYDVSGAGDTVISIAALAIAAGLDLRLMGTLVNVAGGLVCEQIGVVPIDKNLFLEESIRLIAS
jgi:D-glycero-beta-D-manno-heptose-7-phosphate kinase